MLKSLPSVLRLRTVSARSCTEQRVLSTGILRKTSSEYQSGIAQLRPILRRFKSTSSHASIAPQTASTSPTPNLIPQNTVDRIQPPPGLTEDTIEHAVEILATTFQDDPFMRYCQFDEAAGPQTKKLSYEYLKPIMTDILTSFIKDEGATLVTLPGTDFTSAWSIQIVQTSEHPTNLPVPVQELLSLSSHSLKRSLPLGQRYIHAIIVGNRDPNRGVYSKLSRSMLRLADELGLPVYGETTNERSRDVHQHFGFEVGEVFYVGKGRVGMDGMAEEGGSGVPHWPVLYTPGSADSLCVGKVGV